MKILCWTKDGLPLQSSIPERKNHERALYYINKAINIDGENPLYWKKCAIIHFALNNLDEADFAFKQSVELGNYEVDTWLNWAEVVTKNQDCASAVQILRQGFEFYPEEAFIAYRISGLYDQLKDICNASEFLVTALKLDPEKLYLLQKEFPEFYHSKLAQNIISDIQSASE